MRGIETPDDAESEEVGTWDGGDGMRMRWDERRNWVESQCLLYDEDG